MKRALTPLAALLCLLLTACQPTPEKGIVINKNTDSDPTAVQPGSASPADTPQRWTESAQYYDGKLHVQVDADIDAPQSQSWPVYDVKLAGYTQDEADAMIKALAGDARLYDQSGAVTRAQLEKQLLELQLELRQRESGAYTGNSDNSVEDIRRSIELLQQQIPDAPLSNGAVEISTRLHYDAAYDADCLFAAVGSGPAQGAVIDIRSGRNPPYSENRILYSDGASFEASAGLTEASGLRTTREEAVGQGDQLLERMAVEGYRCAAVKVGVDSPPEEERTSETLARAPKCWLLYYTKTYMGIPSTYEDQEGPFGLKEQGYAGPPVLYDRIVVAVDDGGIRSFSWDGREVENGVITENAALKSFDEIRQLFLQGVKIKYAYIEEAETPNGQAHTWQCTVTQIRLGYMRVMSGVGVGGYRAVPVWDFFGSVGPVDGEDAPDPAGRGSATMSLLTINAIDGSIIDRSVGY